MLAVTGEPVDVLVGQQPEHIRGAADGILVGHGRFDRPACVLAPRCHAANLLIEAADRNPEQFERQAG